MGQGAATLTIEVYTIPLIGMRYGTRTIPPVYRSKARLPRFTRIHGR
jgi:hypothetical protein